jgi:outer membrane receptor protein involved in Fe transport
MCFQSNAKSSACVGSAIATIVTLLVATPSSNATAASVPVPQDQAPGKTPETIDPPTSSASVTPADNTTGGFQPATAQVDAPKDTSPPNGARASAPAAKPASAAPPDEQIDSAVVTGHRIDSSVQKSAASVDQISGGEIEKTAVPDITTLIQSVAGVSLKTEGVGQTEIEMRGMTSSGGSSPTTGFYLDDIPLTPPAGAQNGKVVISPSLYDMAGVEVLRGPQGVQGGSGSMGGAIRLNTMQPDTTGLSASMQSILSGTQGGGFNHADNFMLNIPLVENTMALRIVVTEASTSGWIDRIVADPFPMVSNGGGTRGNVQAAPVVNSFPDSNSSQQYNLRTSLLWKLTPQLTITPALYYFTSSQAGISAYDSTPGTETHYQPFNIPEPLTDRIVIASFTAKYAFEKSDLTWATSYWNRRSTQVEDGSEDFNNPATGATLASEKNPGGPQPGYYGPGGTGAVVGTEDDPSRQVTSELRLASKGDGRFQWVVGGYASDYSATWNFSGITANPSVYMDLGTTQAATTNQWFVAHSPTTTTQFALFGDASYALDDHWKVEAGARVFRNDYQFSSTITGWGSGLGAATPSSSGLISEQQFGINPKLSVSYDFTPDMMVYADVARGSRLGGGNALYPTTGIFWGPAYAPLHYCCGWPASYRPDDVLTYEVGEKARFFDRRLIVDASAYYENWKHPQLLAYPGDWAFNINGDKAEIEGGDVSVKAILGGGFELSASLGYTHDNVDPGPHWEIQPTHVMPDVPLFNGNVSLTYHTDLPGGHVFSAQIDTGYVGARYSLNFLLPYQSTGEYVKLPSYDLTNLNIGLDSHSGWGVSLFVNNLFNKQAALENLFQETEPSAAFSRVLTNQPRTIGLNLRYDL